MVRYYSDINVIKLSLYTVSGASLGDSYHVRRARLNLMTLIHGLGAVYSSRNFSCRICAMHRTLHFLFGEIDTVLQNCTISVPYM